MAITFAYRSQTATGLDAYYAANGATGTAKEGAGIVPAVIAFATTGVLGGEILSLDGGSNLQAGVMWNGNGNLGQTLTHSFLWRGIMPDLSLAMGVWNTQGPSTNRGNLVYRSGNTTRTLGYDMTATGAILNNGNLGGTLTLTANTVHDLVWTWTYAAGSSNFAFYIDGATGVVASVATGVMTTWKNGFYQGLMVGADKLNASTRQLCNEFVVWDEIIDPTSINLVHASTGVTSTAQTLNGASRTGWVDVANLDGNNWTSITAGNIQSGISQIQAGLTQTGTFASESWTTITAAQIQSGVNQIQNSTTITGTYLWETLSAASIQSGITQIQNSATITGTYLWQTLAAASIKSGITQIQDAATITGTYLWNTITAANIKSGVNTIQDTATITGTYLWQTLAAADIRNTVTQIQDSVTTTGTFAGEVWSTISASQISIGINQIQNGTTITGILNTPVAIGGTATTVNIPNIKELIRFVLADNNTTTSSILDLSSSMSTRVKQVAKLNPEKIPFQPSVFPYVTIYTDRKSVDIADISSNQVAGRRKAELTFKLVGAVLNTNYQSNIFNDAADEDIEKLMENVEGILRGYPDLNQSIKWQFPTDVQYFSTNIGEDAHMRVGVLDLQATLFY